MQVCINVVVPINDTSNDQKPHEKKYQFFLQFYHAYVPSGSTNITPVFTALVSRGRIVIVVALNFQNILNDFKCVDMLRWRRVN